MVEIDDLVKKYAVSVKDVEEEWEKYKEHEAKVREAINYCRNRGIIPKSVEIEYKRYFDEEILRIDGQEYYWRKDGEKLTGSHVQRFIDLIKDVGYVIQVGNKQYIFPNNYNLESFCKSFIELIEKEPLVPLKEGEKDTSIDEVIRKLKNEKRIRRIGINKKPSFSLVKIKD